MKWVIMPKIVGMLKLNALMVGLNNALHTNLLLLEGPNATYHLEFNFFASKSMQDPTTILVSIFSNSCEAMLYYK
jgi:hypothetical protein